MSFREQIIAERIPSHIAIIMDGNGRWATAKGLERQEGHVEGVKTVREITEAAREVGIRYLTLYAFSIENWSRPKEEVVALMTLLVKSLKGELDLLMSQGIRLRVIGNLDYLDTTVREELNSTLNTTAENKNMDLVLALSYGSRWEIVSVAKKMSEMVGSGELKTEEITEELFSKNMSTSFMPDPELLIRTSGEIRISNFLLWQIAYSELYFTPVLWPDFTKEMFFEAIVNFQQRQRRFGKTSYQFSGKRED